MAKLRAANGVRNDVSSERFGVGDLERGANIDLDETGKAYRRLATSRVTTGDMHSLKQYGTGALVVKDGVLSTITTAGTTTALRSGITDRVAYREVNGEMYWSDRSQSGIVSEGADRRWGIAVPPLPSVAAINGAMPAGTYQYTVTYVRADGVESGAVKCGSITLAANQGLSFTGLAASSDATVLYKRVYVTRPNGELPYAAATLLNAATAATITALPTGALPLRTQFMGPPPAGQVIGYYNGRMYVGSGQYLWYSQPYEYELFDLTSGFIALGTEVKTFAPVSTGVFVGTETETVFLMGADPLEFVRKQVAPYGTVLGTEYTVRNDVLLDKGAPGMTPVWMSKTGLCLGLDTGDMMNLTSNRFILPPVAEGASLMKLRSATPQLVTTLYS